MLVFNGCTRWLVSLKKKNDEKPGAGALDGHRSAFNNMWREFHQVMPARLQLELQQHFRGVKRMESQHAHEGEYQTMALLLMCRPRKNLEGEGSPVLPILHLDLGPSVQVRGTRARVCTRPRCTELESHVSRVKIASTSASATLLPRKMRCVCSLVSCPRMAAF